ncbi:MAG: type II secretion system protein [Phycisphaerae bacterium]
MKSQKKHTRSGGFSMIEVLIAIMLVGIAVVSIVASSGSLTQVNAAGAELSTAEFLIEQIRELTDLLPVKDPQTPNNFGPEAGESLINYDDVDDFHNPAGFKPPISANRQVLTDFAAYSQQVIVEYVHQNDFSLVDDTRTSNFVRVTVKVLLNGNEISSASWLRTIY